MAVSPETVFFILSERQLKRKFIMERFGPILFRLLDRREQLIRNNGLMGSGVEVPFHEAIIFNL